MSCGAQGGTKDDLMHLSGLSQGAFYKAIKPLQEERTVAEIGDRYRLLMSSLQNYRFKLWRDAVQLQELPLETQGYIGDVIAQAKDAYGESLEVLWLIGSAAHGEFDPIRSDIDFLAIVRRPISDFRPRVSHPVQFATLTAKEFVANLEAHDNFCLTALRYGILLEDKGLARIWLDHPASPEITGKPFKEIKATLDHLRGRFLFYLRSEAEEERKEAVKAYAISLGRAMLAAFQELPNGKPELLQMLEFYYSKSILSLFQPAIECQGEDRFRELERVWEQFRAHHLELIQHQDFLKSSGFAFNLNCGQLIKALTNGVVYTKPKNQIDWAFTLQDGRRIYLDCKSTHSGSTTDELKKFCVKMRESATSEIPHSEDLSLFVVNPFNKRNPLWRDWGFTSEEKDWASQNSVHLASSRELLSHYNYWKLTGYLPDHSTLSSFLLGANGELKQSFQYGA